MQVLFQDMQSIQEIGPSHLSANRRQAKYLPWTCHLDRLAHRGYDTSGVRKPIDRIEVRREQDEHAFGSVEGFCESDRVIHFRDCKITTLLAPRRSFFGITHHSS